MSLRLLSFLNDIEQALLADPASKGDAPWEISRMVSYDNHLARMMMTPRRADVSLNPAGSIFLQAFELADGVACLKASLHWKDEDRFTMMTVHARRAADWQTQASHIAKAWFAGPPAASVERALSAPAPLAPLAAMAS